MIIKELLLFGEFEKFKFRERLSIGTNLGDKEITIMAKAQDDNQEENMLFVIDKYQAQILADILLRAAKQLDDL